MQGSVFALLIFFLWLSGLSPSVTWMWLPMIVIVNYLLIVACAMAVAALVCIIADLAVVVSLAMTFLLFTSGIFWDPRALDHASMDLLFLLNPIAFRVDAYRQVLMEGTVPDLTHLLILGLASGGAALVVAATMRRGSKYLALKALTA